MQTKLMYQETDFVTGTTVENEGERGGEGRGGEGGRAIKARKIGRPV